MTDEIVFIAFTRTLDKRIYVYEQNVLFPLRWSVYVTRINLGLMMTAGLHSTSSRGPISGGLVIALELTGMSLSITRGGLMLYVPRLFVSLVSEAGMFWWTPSVSIIKWWSTLQSTLFGSSSDSSLPPRDLIGGGWLAGLWVGREGIYAVGPFWQKAVQGFSRSAIHLPSVSVSLPLLSGHGRWSGPWRIWIPMVAVHPLG